MTFQQMILALQKYWADRGCLIVQPWDIEKGAGTFNAATYLRALGPESWNVAYVEPSRRPTDGRYGDNPNRLERHHQFQVLLKPSPRESQEIYLGSLRALGIDPFVHDIRFVEDNWESPTLGAWGLGWEVWCDGMEITQFTYFQQCGGYELQPVSVELTYGLERLAMYLQNKDDVYDLEWGGGVTYRQVRHLEEVQWSSHNFEHADIGLHLRWFEENMGECKRLADAGLVIPAYDYCLRCSHTFNILDARGAIGVTERQAYILRVRDVSKRCADAWMALRESMGFPLTRSAPVVVPEAPAAPAPAASAQPAAADVSGPFLLEIGTEEIPARLAPKGAEDLLARVTALLAELGLEGVTGGRADCTPRRLVVAFDRVPLRQPDREELIKGPPTRVAFDAAGTLTKAGEAFRAKLLPGDEEFTEETPKGAYLMVRRRSAGRAVAELLAEALPALLGGIHWPKPMRWSDEPQPFVRPVLWIACVLGGQVVPFRFAGVQSGAESRGHRFHAPEPFPVADWASLEAGLEARQVVLSSAARRARILEAVQRVATEAGGRAVVDAGLLDEVTHIVELPVAMLGRFEPELLELPRQAVVTPMRVHQRYFPIEDAQGALLPAFVVVGGTQVADASVVAQGNARVLRARLADARYFFTNDLQRPLESRLEALVTRIWLAQHGAVRQKVERLVALGRRVGGGPEAERVALLCKCDLGTEMVGEFAELQGEMGRVYARRQGEVEEVAEGIFEHYLPRSATDDLPATRAGTVVALADRFDSIVGCFAIGLKPTGSKDPYALRRQAIAVINILTDTAHDIPRDLPSWIDAAAAGYPGGVDGDCRQAVLEFFADRTRFLHRDRLPKDVVDAVVATGCERPADVYGKIGAAATLRDRGELEPVLITFRRVANITRDVPFGAGYDASALIEPAERDLAAAFDRARSAVPAATAAGDFEGAVRAMAELRPLVDRVFDDILVMAEEPALRSARLGILGAIRDLFGGLADFSRIQERR